MAEADERPERDWLAELRAALLPVARDGSTPAPRPGAATAAPPGATVDETLAALRAVLDRLDDVEDAVRAGRTDLTPIEARLDALEAAVVASAGAGAPAGGAGVDLSPIESRLDALEAAVAAVADALASAGPAGAADRAAVVERLDLLARRPDPAERIDALARALTALPATVAAEVARIVAEDRPDDPGPLAAPPAGAAAPGDLDLTDGAAAAAVAAATDAAAGLGEVADRLAALDATVIDLREEWAASEAAVRAESAAAVEAMLAAVDAASAASVPDLPAMRHQLDVVEERIGVIERAIVALATMVRDEIDRNAGVPVAGAAPADPLAEPPAG